MSAVAITLAVLLALFAIPVSITESALRRDSEKRELAASWSFLRLVLTSLFALIVGQQLTPIGYLGWVNVILALVITLLMVVLTQLGAKYAAHAKLGQWLLNAFAPAIKSLNILFTPLSGPKDDTPEEFEQELLESVEDFTETIVREVMIPRIDMATIPAGASLQQAMKIFMHDGYSRMPLVGKSVDDVQGVLYVKDIARIAFEQPKLLAKEKAVDYARKVLFVPDSKGVDDLLREMQLQATHIAMIVDEYGGVAGLVTLEDLIEEIVGEIADEYDQDEPEDLVDLGDGRYRVQAGYSLDDLGENLNLELADEDVDSVGGLLVKTLGHIARAGDNVTIAGIKITAERIETRRKRLTTVLVERSNELEDIEAAFNQETE